MASNHRYLLHCVLAVASLHLARLHDDKTMKAEMTATAATQMNKALLLYRPALENLNHTNSAALFASSALTAVYFFRTTVIDFEAIFASVPSGTSTPPPVVVDKMIQCVLKIIWGFRGPAAVLRPNPGYEWSLDRRLQHIATRKWWPRKRVPATQRALEEDARLCKIERLWMHPGRDYEEHFKMLARHLNDLRDTFALVSQLTLPSSEFPSMTSIPYSVDDTTDGFLKDRGAVFVWPTLISSEFIDLVVQKNREALVIVAHYAILIGRVRNVWWVEGIGPHLLVAVAMALGRENWHLIEWPVQALGVDLENAFGSRRDRLEGKPGEMHMDVI
ncbi:hypothetical protein BS50DRAFT_582365 [Corynespora cassiicola Philippines]|uniref:C6 zinc finger domain-containing protein n=1 Tax=Corynespora cassiicola Philippines TaxID=1448308 RepID=A0A2T2P5F6_CORCC|nr:hypothetical protein BS50DRAFT_582365 [Corynespora cassiicola Philippines]